MTKRKDRSLYEEVADTRAGANALAAADLAIQVSRLLYLAISRTKITQADLAGRLGVTEGRVSQVLNGDGNVHIATLGRFMRAMGYRIQLRAEPTEGGLEPIEQQRPRRTREDRRRAAEFSQLAEVVTTISTARPNPVGRWTSSGHPTLRTQSTRSVFSGQYVAAGTRRSLNRG